MDDQKGFTIIELLIYIGLLSLMLLTIGSFSKTLLESRVRHVAIQEVEQQGMFVMNTITQAIRNSEIISSPAMGSLDTSLSISSAQASLNPTIFDILNNVIRVKEGINNYIPLTNSKIVASDLNFENLSKNSTPGTIKIQFTLKHKNSGGKAVYDYSQTFYGSASLR